MNENSMQQLSEKLQLKMEQDRKQVEELTQSELNKLNSSFRTQLKDALSTTLSDTRDTLNRLQEQNSAVRRASARTWLKPLLIGLLLSVGLAAGTGGAMYFLTNQVQDKIDTLTKHNQALKGLEAAGLELITLDGSLYLITAKGSEKPEVYQNKKYPGKWIIKTRN